MFYWILGHLPKTKLCRKMPVVSALNPGKLAASLGQFWDAEQPNSTYRKKNRSGHAPLYQQRRIHG